MMVLTRRAFCLSITATVFVVASCSSGGAKQSTPTTTNATTSSTAATTTMSSPITAMQPVQTTACTLGDLHRAGSVPMPRPAVLGRTGTFNDFGVRLDPPPVGAQPSVSASSAWQAARIKSPEGSYQLLLASYTAPYPSKNRPGDFSKVLAWVVIGRNVPLAKLPAITPPTLPGERRTGGAVKAPCAFDFALDAFDAHTGQELVLTQLVCRVSRGHDSTSVAVKLTKGATATAKIGRYRMTFSILSPPGPDGLGIQRNTVFGPTVFAFGKQTNVVGSGEGYFRPTAYAFGGSSTGGNGVSAYECGA